MSNTHACFVTSVVFLLLPFFITALHYGGGQEDEGGGLFPVVGKHGTVVKKDQRWSVLTAEDGEISAVKVSDGKNGFYHLQFITMEPNSLFLPVHLHSDMVFYVDSGNGTLSWIDLEKDEDKLKQVDLKNGDVYRLRSGSFFYLQSNLESDRRKLRINAIFSDSKEQILEGSSFGAYSSVRDLLLGFDDKVLQAALNVDEGVIQELKSGGKQPMIVHGVSKAENLYEVHYKIMRAFLGNLQNDLIDVSKNKHKDKNKPYNIQEAKHDVDNCNGWSLVVTSKQLKALKDSDFGVFFVNLTTGSMMGPHWNPLTAEIAVVLRGRGMVHVVCPSTLDEAECKNSRFRVEEGDVFVVPRYHPMAQISFNNDSFIFMGFTTTQKNNHPQYLVGTASVFQALDKRVLATSLGVSNTTMDEILSAQRAAIILECTSCAEEEESLMEEEIQRQEEEKRREEEEARKREEEEEEARRQREEEAAAAAAAAAKQREEEAAKQREQEEAAARQREEEAARQREQEEEAARQREQEEEAAREREQEEAAAAAAKQREEEAARQREQEAAVRKREEEAARERQQEEAEAAEAEEAARQQQQEEEAEKARQREQQEEAARQREQEGEAARKREQEEEAARQRQQEEDTRQRQQKEAAARQRQEAEAAKQQEEARRRQQEEEAAGRQQHEKEAPRGAGGEGEAASMEEGAMAQRHREAEEAARRREARGQGGVTYEE